MNDATRELVSEKIEQTVETAEEIVRHPFVKRLAEFGFYTKGFLFIVIGVLAILVALGDRSGRLADANGALTLIAQYTYGKILLIIFTAGAFGHGAWNILRGVADVDNAGVNFQGISKRVIAVSVGLFYFFLAWTAWTIVLTNQVSVENGTLQKTLTGIILALPLGAVVVFVIGLSVIGAGINECYRGITGKFQEDFRLRELQGGKRKVVTVLGALSFTARAVIFGLMGYFFITAAIESDPNVAMGIDGALRTLGQNYYGKMLLFIAATGVICHGVLSLYEARYRRIC
ncbi:MAG: DUF1206 domain-containing protein [Acidobacteriota bacterium]|nr:DUF1206 domain-containing protein [Acidobacteriota bacterium]